MKLSSLSKTVVAALALTFTLNVATPTRAEAGIIFYAIGSESESMTDEGRRLFKVTGVVLFVIGMIKGNWKMVILDNEQNQTLLAKQLKEKYEVLADQPHVANKLATALSRKAAELFKTHPHVESVEATLDAEQAQEIADELVLTEENTILRDELVEQLTQ